MTTGGVEFRDMKVDLDSLSPQSLHTVWQRTQERMRDQGRWLIGEPLGNGTTYKTLLERLSEKSPPFRGAFILHDLPQKISAKRIEFAMTNRDVCVGDMKKEIAKITGLASDCLQISFQGLLPLEDDISLYSDLHCHGRGGENFHLTFRDSKQDIEFTLSDSN